MKEFVALYIYTTCYAEVSINTYLVVMFRCFVYRENTRLLFAVLLVLLSFCPRRDGIFVARPHYQCVPSWATSGGLYL